MEAPTEAWPLAREPQMNAFRCALGEGDSAVSDQRRLGGLLEVGGWNGSRRPLVARMLDRLLT